MIKLVFACSLLFLITTVQAQTKLSTTNKKAISFYQSALVQNKRFQYEQAVLSLNSAIKKDSKFFEAYFMLASMYNKLKNYSQAVVVLEQGLLTAGDNPAVGKYYKLAGEIYFKGQEYKKSAGYLREYLEVTKNLGAETRRDIELLKKSAEFAEKAIKHPVKFDPTPLPAPVNLFPIQYFPVLTVDEEQLIFTARRGTNPGQDENIYVCRKDASGGWQRPRLISESISRREVNEGACTISADGKVLVFTICKDRRGLGSCDLYITRKTGDRWSYPRNMKAPVNSGSWESQPSLSADGNTLYFVSDRSGGRGKLDIWRTSLGDDEKWSTPENLGEEINTPYDDITPFIHPNGINLFFSSKGHPGFGGFDLFMAKQENGNWKELHNMGYPLNDIEDQVSLFVTADGTHGYFSHETQKDYQYESKINVFEIPEENRVDTRSIYLTGTVRDDQTHRPLGAEISIYNLASNEKSYKVTSDSINGRYYAVLNEGGNYGMYVTKIGYIYRELNFDLKRSDQVMSRDTVNVELTKIDVGKKGILKNIFFDFDKYELKEASKSELDVFIAFLRKNTTTKVEIQGHTDKDGSDAYNLSLSKKRAGAVYNYVVDKGISPSRLLHNGYGSSRPIASNDTEEGKSKNRRIEFVITK